ncbi:MAG: L-rhamnose mutarotase [Cyclobacteriaceae bacterium]
MNVQRMCFGLDLKDDPDLIKQYEDYHQKVWPEVLKSITDSGVLNMEIYRTGNRLFMIMEINESFDEVKKQEAVANNPKVQEWESLMDIFQQRLPWANENQKWVPMKEIFNLKKQV